MRASHSAVEHEPFAQVEQVKTPRVPSETVPVIQVVPQETLFNVHANINNMEEHISVWLQQQCAKRHKSLAGLGKLK